ncbi:MAG: tripartite tricarboxylate transporter permease [Alphaproteobacteria bacterium]|nr:tripartite tricarboxylate transporter permease [Alphaproteobacteria bacterium]
MLDALLTGLDLVFEWPSIGFLMLGVVLGIWIGAVPGLGGIIGLVLLLPFTFGMEPIPAMALLLGLWTVTTTSDTISSVMLGIPGTAASQATILDGYPLAQQGQAGRAFGAAFTVSAFGGVFGAIILAVSLPIIAPLILAFRSPELFMLGMLGLTMVGTLSGSSVLKGLIAAMFGLMLGFVGMAETIAMPRFHFDSVYLLDELPIIPVVLGLFALPELLELAVRNVSISRIPKHQAEGGGIMDGIRDAFKYWWLVLRCSVIGAYIGMLPGLGASIVDWVAYGHAVQSTKDNPRFGHGDIRGVIAPEAANNAIKGGALVPTVAFGIPGSLGTAILLGALVVQGIRPGPDMLTDNLHITFSLVWMIVVANVAVSILLLFLANQVAKVAFVPGHLIVPGVIATVFMGAWLGGASIGDWITCLSMGVIGYTMKRGGWPRPPLILALILGNILENTFQISMRVAQGWGWLSRPIVLIILAIIVLTLVFAVSGIVKKKQQQAKEGEQKDQSDEGEGNSKNPLISLPFGIVLAIIFIWAGIEAQPWPEEVKQFPVTIAIPAAILTLAAIFYDTRNILAERLLTNSWGEVFQQSAEKAVLGRSLIFFGYLIALILVTFVIGQKLALALFIGVYLWRWGGYSARISIGYAIGGWIFIVAFYDRIMNLLFHPSWLHSWIIPSLPEWMPTYLF